MKIFQKLSIKNKIIAIVLSVNIISLIIGFSIVIINNTNKFKLDMATNLQLNAKIVGEACTTTLAFDDKKGAANTLKTLQSISSIENAQLFDEDNKFYAEYKRINKTYETPQVAQKASCEFVDNYLIVFEPVILNGKKHGTLYIKASTEELSKKTTQYIFTMLSLLLALFSISFIFARNFQKIISKPILHLANASGKISRDGNYSLRVKKQNEDEIGKLYDEFNHMLEQIGHRDNAIRESEEKFKAMSESAFDAIVLLNEKGQIYFWNKAAEIIFGYTASETIGKAFYKMLIQENQFQELIENVLKHDETQEGQAGESLEFIAKKKDNTPFPIEISISSMEINQGRHVVGIIKDITERKRNEEDLRKAKDDAEEADRLKSAFLANISHEIRTPMNSIIGFSELLIGTKLPEDKHKKYLEIIYNNGKKLMNLINDIIDISKIEAGKIKINNTEANINAILSELNSHFRQELIQKKCNFELRLNKANDDQNFTIITDPFRLRQIFGNLLSNALKFTKSGFVEFGYFFKDKKTIQFFVRDTGIGIPEDRLDVIFERFGQIDNSLTRNTGGTGIGLSIAKRLTELLGGKMYVESKVNEGSTFYFTMPFIRIEVPEKEYLINPEDLNYHWAGKTIAVAEDELANFLLIKELLDETKAKILHAQNGEEIIDLVYKHHDIDMILMDINMPKLNGYEATKKIKDFNNQIIIIAQTAFAMSGEREKSLEAGCDDYVAKPINAPELLATMGKHMR